MPKAHDPTDAELDDMIRRAKDRIHRREAAEVMATGELILKELHLKKAKQTPEDPTEI